MDIRKEVIDKALTTEGGRIALAEILLVAPDWLGVDVKNGKETEIFT